VKQPIFLINADPIHLVLLKSHNVTLFVEFIITF